MNQGSVALLGDACRPTLPYQAQEAAMAVEDGAVLGKLLGLLSQFPRIDETERHLLVPAALKLSESLRKSRTTLNVQGAVRNQEMYHMAAAYRKNVAIMHLKVQIGSTKMNGVSQMGHTRRIC